MTTKHQRFMRYLAGVDSYVANQSYRLTSEEQKALRQKLIAQYDDKFEHHIERIKKGLLRC